MTSVEVRWADASEVWALRTAVLRPNWSAGQLLVFPEDALESTAHVVALDLGQVVGVATFLGKPTSLLADLEAVQLRGMAVASQKQGQGVGKCILDFAIQDLNSKFPDAQTIWCNARESAVKFYGSLGFEIISEVFEIPEIGPHYTMKLSLWKTVSS